MQFGPAFALAPLLGIAASGQQTSPTSQIIPRPAELSPAVMGAPFSAERHHVRSRTLGDGTRITDTWPVQKMYRNSQGQTRTERPLLPLANAPEFPRVVQLDDPAAGVEYILEPQRKLAHRFTLISVAPTPPDSDAAESLGIWVIQGFHAEGVRRTIAIPGGAIPAGIAVTETWTAPDLRTVVLRKSIDPPFGESIEELTRIRTGEQDANLFRVPPDYNVVDEPSDFSVPFTIRSHASLPTILSQVPAVYTEEAKRSGIQGIVRLTLFVDENGKAQAIHVERSLDPGLDQEAIKAVRGWRFQPGEQDGHAVRVPVHVEIAFSLNN
jgi:TonB family protein